MTGIVSIKSVVSVPCTQGLVLSRCLSDSSESKAQPAGAAEGEDRRLVQGCVERDPAALRELLSRYQPQLSRFLGRLLGSPEDTEEVVMEVFLRVWQQAHQFQGRASFSTWLYRIASNAASDRLRRQVKERRFLTLREFIHAESLSVESLNAEKMALEHLEQEEHSRRLQKALSLLRAADRLLLVLYYMEEKDYAEIAQITHCTFPVLKMRLMRARRRLSVLLDLAAGEDPE